MRNRLLRTSTREGLRGYTIMDAAAGAITASATPAGRAATSKLEAICSQEQAERLLAHLQSGY